MLALGANGRGRAGLLSALRPQDVFATSLYTTDGTGRSQIIRPGFAPDFYWTKARSSSSGHVLGSRARPSKTLDTSTTSAEGDAGASAFTADGWQNPFGGSGSTIVGWSIKFAPKFCVEVPYTGDGTSGRVIPHALGIDSGMSIVRRRDAGDNWRVRHRSASGELYLNLTDAQAASFPSITATSPTSFTVGAGANVAGATYVAYLFAHDPDTTNGIVQCGAGTTDSAGNATIAPGWSNGMQWVLFKSSGASGNWFIADATRTPGFSGSDALLLANLSDAETATSNYITPNGDNTYGINTTRASTAFVYMLIRAPIT